MREALRPGQYSNEAEAEFARWAQYQGWEVTKRGWPDFICRRGTEVMAVEVKYSDTLSPWQERTAMDLTVRGWPVYVWRSPDQIDAAGDGLEPVSEVQRVMSDEDISAFEAADVLAEELQLERGRTAAAEQAARLAGDRERALRGQRAAERLAAAHEIAQLREDLGYLVRDVQMSTPYRSVRLKAILGRYPDLAYPEPEAAGGAA